MISNIYGSYNLWTWFRSELIDSIPLQTLMSIDKQYVDHNYDYGKSGGGKRKEQDMGDLLRQLEKEKQEIAELSRK